MGSELDLTEVSEMLEDFPNDNKAVLFERLVEADDDEWETLEDPYHFQLTGALYNFSEDLGRVEGLDRVIELNEGLEDRDLALVHAAIRYYQLANAYSLRAAWSDEDTYMTFFDSEDLLEALGYARASVAKDYSQAISKRRETQSFVNFANILSRTGRVCEALHWYNRAIESDADFGMALGNRGQCKMNYAALLFLEPHTAKMLHAAYKDFKRALVNSEDLYPRAEANFRAIVTIRNIGPHLEGSIG